MTTNDWWGVVRVPVVAAAFWLMQAAGPIPDRGIISGMVTDGQSSPIERAFVNITSEKFSASALTTTDGRFEVPDVPAGVYHVAAVKPGYPDTWFGTTSIDEHGVPVDVDAGQRIEIPIRLLRGGVITGVILDESGDPMPNVWVSAERPTTRSREYGRARGDVTDRRGKYRLFALPPGEYVVVANGGAREVRQTVAGVERISSYRNTFWGDASTAASARRIEVRDGQEIPGVDLRLKRVPLAPVRIIVPAGLSNRSDADVSVTAIGESQPESPIGARENHNYILPAGTWTLRVVSYARPGAYAEETFATDGFSSTELQAALQPAASISGRLVIEGALRSNDYVMGAAPENGGDDWEAGALTGPDDSGAFSIRALAPGRYSLFAWVSDERGGRWTVSVRQGEREIVGPLELRGGQSLGEITMTIKRRPPASTIKGVVLDAAGQPDYSHAVVLINEDERLWNESCREVRVVQPSFKGRFQFADLDPGRYRVVMTELRRPDCKDAASIRALVSLGTAVALDAGETRDFKLTVK